MRRVRGERRHCVGSRHNTWVVPVRGVSVKRGERDTLFLIIIVSYSWKGERTPVPPTPLLYDFPLICWVPRCRRVSLTLIAHVSAPCAHPAILPVHKRSVTFAKKYRFWWWGKAHDTKHLWGFFNTLVWSSRRLSWCEFS